MLIRVLLLCFLLLSSAAQAGSVVVLMHHKFDPASRPTKENLHPHEFRKRLLRLQAEGFTFVDLPTALKIQAGVIEGPPNAVALTFDDGWRSQLSALPALDEVGARGTFFIITVTLDWEDGAYLRGDEVLWLARRHDIGSHTVTHFVTREPTDEEMAEELRSSKQHLERLLQQKVTSLAWPYGRYTPNALAAAQKLGYREIVTVEPGINRRGLNQPQLSRLDSDGRCSTDDFIAALKLGQNCL